MMQPNTQKRTLEKSDSFCTLPSEMLTKYLLIKTTKTTEWFSGKISTTTDHAIVKLFDSMEDAESAMNPFDEYIIVKTHP